MDDVLLFAADMAEELGIPCPGVVIDPVRFGGGSFAALECKDNVMTIYLKSDVLTADLCFGIAHEMRHAWQLLHCEEMLEGHFEVGVDVDLYNIHPSEVDANAYAMIVMVDLFGIKPRFDGFGEVVRGRIEARAREIAEGGGLR